MSIQKKIYDLLPVPFQNLGVSLYGIKREYDRYGGTFKNSLNKFIQIERNTNQFIEEYQLNELKKLISIAGNSTYYRKIFCDLGIDSNSIKSLDDIKKLPILDKDNLRNNEEKFNTFQKTSMLHFHTSGSTGTPLNIKMTKEDFRDRMALLERMKICHGVNRKMRHLSFVGKTISKGKRNYFWRHNFFGNQLVMSVYDLHENNQKIYLDKIKKYRPEVVEGYPSVLNIIALWILEHKININARAVFATAETLLDEQRERIENAFHCPVVNYYGSSEGAPMITQCECGRLHLNYESGIIEFLREDGSDAKAGELAKMIVTSFGTKAMPLIRYDIRDMAIFSYKKCSCNRSTLVIDEIIGRMEDVFETPYKGIVTRLSTSLKLLPSEAKRAQLQQHSPTDFVLLLETSGELPFIDINPAINDLKDKLGQVNIKVLYTNSIPVGSNGKFRTQIKMK